MLAEGKIILDMIPQRPPMVMVDKLIECDNHKTITSLKIREGNILSQKGYFTEAGLVENIAQSAALRIGWLAVNQQGKNKRIPVGVIGGIKNFRLYFLPELKSEIITEIIIKHEIFNATIITGTVKVNGKMAAECEMKIFIKDD
jgi:3-hydroxymyristoyl/3-hydroxydecanoyl-(acyl carrier protein) dehydratase